MKLYGHFRGNFGPKYGNKKVSHAGYSFASKAEAALFDHLKLLEKAGELKDVRCQKHVYLTEARITYIPDFIAYSIPNNRDEYFEQKGFMTPEWRIKKRLWEYYGPGPLHIYMGSYKKIFLAETVIPKEPCQKNTQQKKD